jgi:hypothetical protein
LTTPTKSKTVLSPVFLPGLTNPQRQGGENKMMTMKERLLFVVLPSIIAGFVVALLAVEIGWVK